MIVQSQTWAGTYTADSTCNRTVCCCLNGQVVVSQPSIGILLITSGLSGVCDGISTFTDNATYSGGYTGYLTVDSQNITLTLSSDSKTITAVNPSSSACNGNASKNSAIKQLGNTMAMIVLVLIGLIKTVF